MFLNEPPPTQFDLRFEIFGFRCRVNPFFWLSMLFFGSDLRDPIHMILWIGVGFVSILVHELGHAFLIRRYGDNARIVLYGLGGLAIPERNPWDSYSQPRRRTTWTQVAISFAGPGAGFLLALATVAAVFAVGGKVELIDSFPFYRVSGLENIRLWYLVHFLLSANIFWGLLNLLPVYPLDGGQISRELMQHYDYRAGLVNSLWLSLYVSAAVAVLCLYAESGFSAIMFGLNAYNNYQELQHRSMGGFGGGNPW